LWFLPWAVSTMIFPASGSHLAGITGMYRHAQPFQVFDGRRTSLSFRYTQRCNLTPFSFISSIHTLSTY
jgi:hypothetical protein